MVRFLFSFLLILGSLAAADPRLADVRKIWDAAPHNAFTDLAFYHGYWYCVFREGAKHVSPDGKLRVIRSKDGEVWKSAALISDPRGDLRDAKLAINNRDELVLVGAVALDPAQGSKHKHQSIVWFSRDGRKWSKPKDVADPDYWLWRVTFTKDLGLGIGYTTNVPPEQRAIRLYSSADQGRTFSTLVEKLEPTGYPNETAIRFHADGTALCLLRRDPGTGYVGTARAPYRDWTWRELDRRIGGPNFIELPDGRFVAAVRLHDGRTRTSLAWLDPEKGTVTEFIVLPSGGDSSYAGMVLRGGELWVSYYSSHEGKTSIYLARLKVL